MDLDDVRTAAVPIGGEEEMDGGTDNNVAEAEPASMFAVEMFADTEDTCFNDDGATADVVEVVVATTALSTLVVMVGKEALDTAFIDIVPIGPTVFNTGVTLLIPLITTVEVDAIPQGCCSDTIVLLKLAAFGDFSRGVTWLNPGKTRLN